MSGSTAPASNSAKRILIYCGNATSIGAVQVGIEFLSAANRRRDNRVHFVAVVPDSEEWRHECEGLSDVETIMLRRRLPNALSRTLELLRAHSDPAGVDAVINLGNIPLRTKARQVVFVQQPNLASPRLYADVEHTLAYRLQRWFFRRNQTSAENFVTQTDVMRAMLIKTFPVIRGRTHVIPHPVAAWARDMRCGADLGLPPQLTLFYPSAGYPYKNHDMLVRASREGLLAAPWLKEIILTVRPEEIGLRAGEASKLQPLHFAGRLDHAACRKTYSRCHGLLFPSRNESYGLPILEAMGSGLPVICADLPYAHWFCGDKAFYFEPGSPASLQSAMDRYHRYVAAAGIAAVDWVPELNRFPPDWDMVVGQYLGLFGLAR